MRVFYFLILTAAYLLLPTNMSAQNDNRRNLVIYLNDNTKQSVPVSSIDSIAFEKSEKVDYPFQVSLNNISELYSEFTIIPDDPNMTYNIMCDEKSVIDEYDSEEAILADDKLFFQELADGYGVSFAEIMEGFLITGEFNDFNTGLLPGTEYIMRVYGMTPEGEITTPMLSLPFKTAPVEYITNKIAIETEVKDGQAKVKYIPDDNNLHYTAGYIDGMYVTDYDNIPRQVQEGVSEQIIDYILGNAPLSEYIEDRTSIGTTEVTYTGIDSNSIYYVVAGYLDENCGICSDVTIKTIGDDTYSRKLTPSRMARLKSVLRKANKSSYKQAE